MPCGCGLHRLPAIGKKPVNWVRHELRLKEQGRAGQSRAGQDRTEQGTGQSRAQGTGHRAQGSAGQWAGQGMAGKAE